MPSENSGWMSAPARGSMAWVKAQRKAANVSNTPATPAQQIYAQREAISAVPTSPVYTPPPSPPPPPPVYYPPVVEAAPAPPPEPVAPPRAPADVSEETLKKTPEYMARERAILAALDLFNATQRTEKTRYEENYGKYLSELGYDPTSAKFDLGELLTSGQRATTSGKAYNALRNDFAARGMLQSGAFQTSQGVLRDQLMRQREAIDTGRTRFLEDQAAKLTALNAQNEQARIAALAEAKQAVLDRYAAGA